jgi:uncharacterized peroxidase-related enzyme
MPHISLPEGLPGILGPMAYAPETSKPLNDLAETLLRGPSALSRADRELVAAHVSARNDCMFCHSSHGAVAAYYLDGDEGLVESVKRDPESAEITSKLKALLAIAARVQEGGRCVSPEDIQRARDSDATDREIHDVVLIAAAFCMYNRYVDGLATWAPTDSDAYREVGSGLAQRGYVGVAEDLRGAGSTAPSTGSV